jgi:hypothetical protein
MKWIHLSISLVACVTLIFIQFPFPIWLICLFRFPLRSPSKGGGEADGYPPRDSSACGFLDRGLVARNRCRTRFLSELFNDCVSIRLPLNVNTLTSFHPGNELKADALNSYLFGTEELPYPQDRPCSLAQRLHI